MIYSRFGSQVTILEDTGGGWVNVRRESDGTLHEWHVAELKADGGIAEITAAIAAVKAADVAAHQMTR
jgi:hypothetical protein